MGDGVAGLRFSMNRGSIVQPAVSIAVAFAAVLLTSPPVEAQDTREQVIAAEQQAKAQHLEAEGPTRAEVVVVRVMRSPLLAGSGGPFPWFGSVYEGTGFGTGFGYLRRMPHSSSLTAIGGISINGSTLLSLDYMAPGLADDRLQPFASIHWTRAKDVAFYGLGNDSSLDRRAGYNYDPFTVSTGVRFRAAEWLSFTASYESIGFETHVLGSRTDPLTLQRLSDNSRLRFNGTQFGIAFDTRTSPAYSTHGTLLQATTAYFSETHDQPFEFRQTQYKAVQLIPLVREQFVLAFRALATFTNPDSGNSAPLALLPYIGSGSTLRGFTNRRFVDRDAVVLTAEYRWRPSRYLDMALFVDSGQVSPTARELAWDRMRTSWGIGARLHGPALSAVRAELARSSEGFQLVFATSAPF
jgi:hypothetical protein